MRVDNGPELTSKALDQWAYLNEAELDFSRLGKPDTTPPYNASKGELCEQLSSETTGFRDRHRRRCNCRQHRQPERQRRPGDHHHLRGFVSRRALELTEDLRRMRLVHDVLQE